MLGSGECKRTVLWARTIDHADVLVRGADAMDVQETRGDQSAGAWLRGGRAFPEQFHFQAAFLFRLTEWGGFRVFLPPHFPAERQPLVQVAVVNDQYLALVNDKDGDGEVNLL